MNDLINFQKESLEDVVMYRPYKKLGENILWFFQNKKGNTDSVEVSKALCARPSHVRRMLSNMSKSKLSENYFPRTKEGFNKFLYKPNIPEDIDIKELYLKIVKTKENKKNEELKMRENLPYNTKIKNILYLLLKSKEGIKIKEIAELIGVSYSKIKIEFTNMSKSYMKEIIKEEDGKYFLQRGYDLLPEDLMVFCKTFERDPNVKVKKVSEEELILKSIYMVNNLIHNDKCEIILKK